VSQRRGFAGGLLLAGADVPGVGRTLTAAAKVPDAIPAGGDPVPALTDLRRSNTVIDEPVARRRAACLVMWVRPPPTRAVPVLPVGSSGTVHANLPAT
jgi:hypothetical protein